MHPYQSSSNFDDDLLGFEDTRLWQDWSDWGLASLVDPTLGPAHGLPSTVGVGVAQNGAGGSCSNGAEGGVTQTVMDTRLWQDWLDWGLASPVDQTLGPAHGLPSTLGVGLAQNGAGGSCSNGAEGGVTQTVMEPEGGLRVTTNKRNYKVWTSKEEAKLVEILVTMVKNAKFVSDKSFKHGHLLYLKEQLKVHFPNSSLTDKHIESKIRTLKKDCNAVYEMLNGPNASGFSFLGSTNMVGAPEKVWSEYLKGNPQLAKWKTKEFPHYYDLCMVFRKDRAQGSGSMSVEIKDGINMDVLDSGEQPSSVRSGKRKRQADEEPSSVRSMKEKCRVDPMVDVSSEACKKILGDHCYKAATKMNPEEELQEAFEMKVPMVISELYKMELSQEKMFKAIDIITRDRLTLDIFCSLRDEERELWVNYKLPDDLNTSPID